MQNLTQENINKSSEFMESGKSSTALESIESAESGKYAESVEPGKSIESIESATPNAQESNIESNQESNIDKMIREAKEAQEKRLKQIDDISKMSPLDMPMALEQLELYDMIESQAIIDEVYKHFATNEDMIDSLLKPIGCKVLNGVFEAFSWGRALRKRGITPERLINECGGGFSYENGASNINYNDPYMENKNERSLATKNEFLSEEYDSSKYHDSSKISDYKENNTSPDGTIIDEYTGKKIAREDTDTDHIISKSAFHKEVVGNTLMGDELKKNVALTDSDVKKAINVGANYADTDKSLNRAKGDKSVDEFVKHMKEKGTPLDKKTEATMRKKEGEAKEAIQTEANKAIIKNLTSFDATSRQMYMNISSAAATQAGNQAVGAIVMFITPPLYYELSQVITDKGEKMTFEERFNRLKDYYINNATKFTLGTATDFLKNVVSMFAEIVINAFLGIYKIIFKIIKEGIKILIDAFKLIFGKDSAKMSPEEKGDAILKLIGAAVAGLAGIGIEALLNYVGIGEPLSIVLATIFSGILSVVLMVALDKMDLFSLKSQKRKEAIEKIFDERIAQIRETKEALDEKVLKALVEQKKKFDGLMGDIAESLKTDNMASLNTKLYEMADFMGVKTEWSNTRECMERIQTGGRIKL
ncbi:hypothetical protein CCY99_06935 [Helicobacter sp. 16-1353]|uniref:hypothetical protein n=1 Tax=Helicobacter sp. 16-1353 TaxID=2004996 RepID=UPI000DCD56C2|nr:hypothetical protein [Helicobacter sp. 16-1353]RAX52698.1 hypothetical protein CCY99_06935 [Helicobacter sp. 16-1353]